MFQSVVLSIEIQGRIQDLKKEGARAPQGFFANLGDF